jgi:phage antirepressor YoqD-like protein
MSSREISRLTDKRHDHVLRDTRTMLIGLYGDAEVSAGIPDKDMFEVFCERMGWGIGSPKLGDQRIHGVAVSRDNRGYISEISLDYNHCMTLIAGYSVKLRKAIIDRWQALEEQAAKPALNPANLTRLQLIEMAMQAEQERLVLENKVGELEPKAEALDRLATANGSFCIRDAAKTLQVQEKWLKQFMREHEWIYQRPMGHGWLAYADKLKQGVMEHKTTTGEKSDGSEWVDTQARITAKGMTKLSTLIQEHGQPRLAA